MRSPDPVDFLERLGATSDRELLALSADRGSMLLACLQERRHSGPRPPWARRRSTPSAARARVEAHHRFMDRTNQERPIHRSDLVDTADLQSAGFGRDTARALLKQLGRRVGLRYVARREAVERYLDPTGPQK